MNPPPIPPCPGAPDPRPNTPPQGGRSYRESQRTEVRYRDRLSGEIRTETIFSENALRWFYEHPLGSRIFDSLLNRAWFCWLYGALQDLPGSRKKIPAFVATHRIPEEAERPHADYPTFNAFFSRKLTPGARPFPAEPSCFGSPAEGKILVYSELSDETRIPIKGASLTLEALLASVEEAMPFRGGSALVLRLAPYDYHRFHFPDDGVASPARPIRGRYHSVSPIALAKVPDLFCRNKRAVTILDSEQFGRVGIIEVGAICVGTIRQTYRPGPVSRGQEKGFFRFGGSTVVLLFEPDRIHFDEDLIRDSADGLEVQVRVGTTIGRSPVSQQSPPRGKEQMEGSHEHANP